MKKIDIQINQAKLLSYEITLADDMPIISAVIGLFAGEKQISTFSLRTESYYSNSVQFKIPNEIIEPIKDIAKQLEIILIRECSKSMGQLPAGK